MPTKWCDYDDINNDNNNNATNNTSFWRLFWLSSAWWKTRTRDQTKTIVFWTFQFNPHGPFTLPKFVHFILDHVEWFNPSTDPWLGPDGVNVPIDDLVTNINTDPLPVLLRCVGPEKPDQEDVFNGNGRAILDAFCDKNKDGVPQEDEFIRNLTIKDRVERFFRKNYRSGFWTNYWSGYFSQSSFSFNSD